MLLSEFVDGKGWMISVHQGMKITEVKILIGLLTKEEKENMKAQEKREEYAVAGEGVCATCCDSV